MKRFLRILFSEIVIEDELGRIRQYVADPEPTKNQYHGPLKGRKPGRD
ncbi:MAG: hypothetical protein ACHRXM_19220 [Isosphaerales bacterium]